MMMLMMMNWVCVIHHTLLIALFTFSFLQYFSNFTMYIVQKGTALFYSCGLYSTLELKIMQTWINTDTDIAVF